VARRIVRSPPTVIGFGSAESLKLVPSESSIASFFKRI
jgi:hypothetical protein